MARWLTSGPLTAEFACELVLLDEDESRIQHTFLEMVGPGTYIHLGGREWTVIEVRERRGMRPEVICSPAKQCF
jgi:hypothetical protein